MPDSLNGGVRRALTPAEQAVHAQLELAQLNTANMAAMAELARMGAQVDSLSLLNGRIEVLAELVFGGENSAGMFEFRLQFARKVAKALEELSGQARKAQLAAGAYVPPEQVRQMAKVQGLLGPDGNPIRR